MYNPFLTLFNLFLPIFNLFLTYFSSSPGLEGCCQHVDDALLPNRPVLPADDCGPGVHGDRPTSQLGRCPRVQSRLPNQNSKGQLQGKLN